MCEVFNRLSFSSAWIPWRFITQVHNTLQFKSIYLLFLRNHNNFVCNSTALLSLRNVSCAQPLDWSCCLRAIWAALLCRSSTITALCARRQLRTAGSCHRIVRCFGGRHTGFCWRLHGIVHFVQIFSHSTEKLHCCCWYLFIELQLSLLVSQHLSVILNQLLEVVVIWMCSSLALSAEIVGEKDLKNWDQVIPWHFCPMHIILFATNIRLQWPHEMDMYGGHGSSLVCG